MLKYIIIFLTFAFIFAWEVPRLVRNKEKKELVIFSFLTLIGFGLSILAVFRGFM
ncbi:hypothetical protein [Metabacillus niabensis]|uniref:Uncharacterized protein n=1 Tax=Metabacillus niabensis TaxID=324854 RepID=A0ABT9Z5I1_9BACI|nr:hypothetical protein [Metabacillus niabensis]MDQ0227515.1 hypothetical protein [Metabacillus niabensis]